MSSTQPQTIKQIGDKKYQLKEHSQYIILCKQTHKMNKHADIRANRKQKNKRKHR